MKAVRIHKKVGKELERLASGQFRIFYYTKQTDAILVFHFFKKKTQETPAQEIKTAKSRLLEML